MNRAGRSYLLGCLASLSGLVLILGSSPAPSTVSPKFPAIEGYEPMAVPSDNPMTPAKARLGEALFADKRMSGDGTVACTTCHQPKFGMTAGGTVAAAYGKVFKLACPSLWNVGYQQAFLWEGGAKSLEEAVHGLWLYNLVTPGEGRLTLEDIAKNLGQIDEYRKQFRTAFDAEPSPDLVVKALATYLRTLVPANAAWFRFYRGDDRVFPLAARRGWKVFDGKAGCTNCHSGILLTDMQYHNVGVGMKDERPHPGRFLETKREQDRGAFKTPSLLDIGRSAPYFHDHSVETLEAAVDQMLAGGIDNPNLDRTNLHPEKLTENERTDLLAFLRALNVE